MKAKLKDAKEGPFTQNPAQLLSLLYPPSNNREKESRALGNTTPVPRIRLTEWQVPGPY